MKAILVHQYGGPEVLKYETAADPIVGSREVLVKVAATSVNPFDIKQRSGIYKDYAPLKFPAILGIDVSGTIVEVSPGVDEWKVGDQVFAQSVKTYAQLCIVKSANLVKIPEKLDPNDAAALPTVLTTGNTLVTKGINIQSGQTLLITGALGNVGRSAVFAAKERGAHVIAGVRKKQLQEAANLGVDQVLAIDDEKEISKMSMVDAIADTVGGPTAEKLISKVKKGGIFGSVVGGPANTKDYPDVKVVSFSVKPDASVLSFMTQAVIQGKLQMPSLVKFPLKDADKGHAAFEKGGVGKVLLVAE
jgi:NADPH:quinone reductase-like Zn-dependent oxidoreductase